MGMQIKYETFVIEISCNKIQTSSRGGVNTTRNYWWQKEERNLRILKCDFTMIQQFSQDNIMSLIANSDQ